MSKATTSSHDAAQLPDDSDAFEVRRRLRGDFAPRNHNSDDRFEATDEALPFDGPLRGTDRRVARQFVNELNDSLASCYNDVEVVKVSRTSNMRRLCIRLDTGNTSIGYRKGKRALDSIDTDYELADAYILGSDRFSYGLEL